MEYYQNTRHRDSGIVNDPNEWSGNPRYILALLQKVVTISMAQKRRQLSALQAAYRVSTRRACEVIGLPRATYYYQSHRPTDSALRHRLKELAWKKGTDLKSVPGPVPGRLLYSFNLA